MARNAGGPRWLYGYSFLGLAVGIGGEAYVLSIVIGLLLSAYGIVGYSAVALLLALNFLVLGGLLTFLGIGVTIMGIYIAIRQPSSWTVVGSMWNVFASIWNVFTYIRNFGVAMNLLEAEEKESRGASNAAVVLLALIALITAVLLSYIAYHAGRARATGEWHGKLRDEDL